MKGLTLLFTLFIITVIILADLGMLPHFLKAVYDIPYGDKVGHFVLFGLLNFFLTLSFIRSLHSRTPVWVARSTGFSLMFLITVEEFSQMFFSSRTFDLVDLLAGFVGVLLGGWIAFETGK